MKQETKIKICGVRTAREAVAIADLSADFIGLNFIPGSKHKISYETAASVVKSLIDKKTRCVGLFRDCNIEEINKVSKLLNLSHIQLHGHETPEYCLEINAQVIKAFPVESDFDVEETFTILKKYKNITYLLDRKSQGSGPLLSLKKAQQLATKIPYFFAGGLDAGNVKKIIVQVNPHGVDVASGIETDNDIDILKVKKFINSVRN